MNISNSLFVKDEAKLKGINRTATQKYENLKPSKPPNMKVDKEQERDQKPK